MALWNREENRNDALRQELEQCESVLTTALKHFERAGLALEKIREKQLYRLDFETFDAYLGTRWNMTRQHAARLIDAAQVARELSPTGYKPQNERQARTIAELPQEERPQAWTEAIAIAGGQPTPAAIDAVTEKRRRKKKSRGPKAITIRVPAGRIVIHPGRGFQDATTALTEAITKLSSQERHAA